METEPTELEVHGVRTEPDLQGAVTELELGGGVETEPAELEQSMERPPLLDWGERSHGERTEPDVHGVRTELDIPGAGTELDGGVSGAVTELTELVQGGDGTEAKLAELELGEEAIPEFSDGADLELEDESDLELGGGVGTELADLDDGTKPEPGSGHSTRLLTRPPTELLRAGVEKLVLVVVPRIQSSRCSCLPPILSSVWRRP